MSRAFIERLSKLDRAARARLRRNLQEDLVYPQREALRYVEWWVENEPDNSRKRQAHYLIAGLYALCYPNPDESPTNGDTFARVAARIVRDRDRQEHESNPNKETSLEKRFFQLLECDFGELAYPLRQWCGFVRAGQYGVDWEKLLKDIHYWNERTKDIWARDFYRALKPNAEVPETSETELEEPA